MSGPVKCLGPLCPARDAYDLMIRSGQALCLLDLAPLPGDFADRTQRGDVAGFPIDYSAVHRTCHSSLLGMTSLPHAAARVVSHSDWIQLAPTDTGAKGGARTTRPTISRVPVLIRWTEDPMGKEYIQRGERGERGGELSPSHLCLLPHDSSPIIWNAPQGDSQSPRRVFAPRASGAFLRVREVTGTGR